MSSELRQRRTNEPNKSTKQTTNQTTTTVVSTDESVKIHPSPSLIGSCTTFTLTCLLVLIPIRLLSACLIPIQDCDEQFNYWEPLHQLMFGRGLQTWEYSPLYGLRSYLYLWLVSPVAWLMKWGHELNQEINLQPNDLHQDVNKFYLFYSIRFTFVLASVYAETRVLSSIRRLFGVGLARWNLFFFACSAGMAHATTAFLPQTFTMIFVMLTINAWMNRDYPMAIFYTGVCGLIGWPFSVLLSIPLAIEVVWVYRGFNLIKPIWYGLVSAGICIIPSIIVDHFYYRRFIFAVLNIAMYNSNATSDHGANLFGREPASFYLLNLFLNFNVGSFVLAVGPIVFLAVFLFKVKLPFSVLSLIRLVIPGYLWFTIFILMPHKEERFFFVIYPYFCLTAGIVAYFIQRLLLGPSSSGSFRRAVSHLFTLGLGTVFLLLSVSRIASLVINYGAPMHIWTRLHEEAWSAVQTPNVLPFPHPLPNPPTLPTTPPPDILALAKSELRAISQPPTEVISVCVGKEWYRFGTSFLLPTIHLPNHTRPIEFKLRFLDSNFGGLLPKDFIEEWEYKLRKAKEKYSQLEEDVKAKRAPTLEELIKSKTSNPLLQHLINGGLNIDEETKAKLASATSTLPSILSIPPSPTTFLDSFLSHRSTRPGTFLIPTGMNQDNRKVDEGRFVQPETCHYIVDLDLGDEDQQEPAYSRTPVRLSRPIFVGDVCVSGYEFDVIYTRPFLDATHSTSSIARAFYIPGYSSTKNVMKPYQLLKRVPIVCTEEEKKIAQKPSNQIA